ncbi:MAG: Membrane transport protein [candidate division BRC1 bacterium ADurb.BinA364]|nr:MAG: Membrane transport protein [candidate division BRC1 bacterium ADurb.BinA364]
MISRFLEFLPMTFPPLAGIFLMIALGAILNKRGMLGASSIDALVGLVVNVTLPLLIFCQVVGEFRPDAPEYAGWAVLPLAAIASTLFSLALAYFIARPLCRAERRRPFMAMTAFQNSGFIPLAVMAGLFGGDPAQQALRDRMQVMLFLYILGFSPFMWASSVAILRGGRPLAAGESNGWRRKLRGAINPPFVSNVAAIALCLARLPERLPEESLAAMLAPFRALGDCTVPIVMLALGGMLSSLDFAKRPAKREIGVLILIRLGLLPGLWFAGIHALPALQGAALAMAFVLFVESTMPSATNMAVIARHYGEAHAEDFINHAMFFCYLAALATVPIWLTAWAMAFGLPTAANP